MTSPLYPQFDNSTMGTEMANNGISQIGLPSTPAEKSYPSDENLLQRHCTSSWKELYKAKGSSESQEDRRRELLELQKKKREKSFNAGRQIELLEEVENNEESENENALEEMECTTVAKGRKPRKYAKTLMHSEWMMDVPPDLEDKWFFVPCPAGKRCLVIAQRGTTQAYSASGKLLATFPSLLPGGCRYKSTTTTSSYAVLDCVWSHHSSAYYVLDVLAWGNQPFIDCETEFRFFWLQSQLAEISVDETSKHNKFKFIPLTFKLYSAISLEEVMTGPPLFPEVMDGVLFYHREAHYTAGSCPLVVWLLPFMLPEVLGVPVCDVHLAQQPANYPGHLEFVRHFESQTRYARKQEYKERKAASRFAMQETSMESQSSEDIEIID